MKNKKHGGKRKGAGKPALYGKPMKRTGVYLTDEHRSKAKEIGEGDMAEGIRKLLDREIERTK